MSGPGGGRLPRSACAAALGLALAATLAPSAGAAGVPTPSANIPLGPVPAYCTRAPTGAACENASLGRLNAARAKLGLGPYLVPADFVRLRPIRQWLILVNLDRLAYRLRPVGGLTATLDAIAKQGARVRADPNPWPIVMKLPGQVTIGFTSNWAGGQPNALIAYYGWVYDDGYGSGNIDCPTPSAPGCWGHRRDIFAFGSATSLSMGAAIVAGEPSYAMTIVETTTAPWPYTYTWAAAKADGAGARHG